MVPTRVSTRLYIALVLLTGVYAYLSRCSSNRISSPAALQATTDSTTYTVADLTRLSIKEALGAICGPKESLDDSFLFPEVEIVKQTPGPCKFIIANPKTFLQKPKIAKLYGLDVDAISPTTKLTTLAHMLPIIYIADVHPEYGTVGFALNKQSNTAMMAEMHSSLKSFRDRPVYVGGADNRYVHVQ